MLLRPIWVVLMISSAAAAQPVPAPPPAPAAALPPEHKLQLQGHFGFGFVVHVGGSLRYENVRHGFVVRVGGADGAAIEDEGNGFYAGFAHVGLTTRGNPYAFAELGGVLSRVRAGVDHEGQPFGPELNAYPSAVAGFGGKIGNAIHVGVAGWFPMLGAGLYIGLDFAQW